MIRLILWFLTCENDRLGMAIMELNKWKILRHSYYKNISLNDSKLIIIWIFIKLYHDRNIVY